MSNSEANTIPSVLFLCTGNSCRSQMAEGWLRQLHGQRYQAFSAGIEAHGLNPFAVSVMRESGVDISSNLSNTLETFDLNNIDYVITVCGHANEYCPTLADGTKKRHYGFDDPPKLATELKGEAALAPYRRVRDEIETFVRRIDLFLAQQH